MRAKVIVMTHDHDWRADVGAFPKPPSKVENTIGLHEAWMVVACECTAKWELTLYSRGPWTAAAVRDQLATDLTPEALKRAALRGTRHCTIVDDDEVCGEIVKFASICGKHFKRRRKTEKEAAHG